MIAGPSTERILLDCAKELKDGVLPLVAGDDTGTARVAMLEQVLRNAAARTAHEIAWMREESGALLDYARNVHDSIPNAPALADALEHAHAATDSLHLDDVIDAYRRASEALSCAIEASIAASSEQLTTDGLDLLTARMERERVINCGWGSQAGR
jgi:hypothetical protein